MELSLKFQKLCQIEPKRFLFVVGVMAITHLFCQSLMLPYRNALLSLMADGEVPIHGKSSFLVAKSVMVGDPHFIDAADFTNTLLVGNGKVAKNGEMGEEHDGTSRIEQNTENNFESEAKTLDNAVKLVDDEDVFDDFETEDTRDVDEKFEFESFKDLENSSVIEMTSKTRHGLSLEQVVKPNGEISADNFLEVDTSLTPGKVSPLTSPPVASSINITILKNSLSNASTSIGSATLQSDLTASKNNSAIMGSPVKKKMRCDMPPKSVTLIDQMNRIFIRHRSSSRAMKPLWSSVRDQEMLAARSQIMNAPTTKNDQELYAPLYRNVSMFKRSYELMERVLKVYVYKDGQKPIFHQPILKGLYASEGWFMKLMEGNKRFLVKDPRKAHLFYMPFSSRMLEYSLYVRNSHNRTNLRQYLKEYTEKIAAKYPFFKRTDGADHFLVACHDWAPYETRHHMEHCIKALCNADVTQGFKIGRDVSLPETYVRSARNPLRDLGGKPASERHVLAFYAGNMHGYLRPILLNYWKDKDPNMKIFGAMPPGVASKMNYIEHMKSSKYCICPKGYEVNSPRVVEAIFYECVPVIISDNFVPPFFEVLDWSAFSVILAEKDIPNLKETLLSIPEKKYIEMQLAVRKVQQHFLWHVKPMKYDLFHMTLHSIWYNRVFQVKVK